MHDGWIGDFGSMIAKSRAIKSEQVEEDEDSTPEMKIRHYKLLLFALLIVGCEQSKEINKE